MVSYAASAILVILMFGMGLGLTIDDFRRIVQVPRAALTGLLGQLLLLPLMGLAFCLILQLETEVALGVMLLTLCPGGVLSNMFTLLARGDVALSVSMTAISSFVTVVTLPIALNISMYIFAGNSVDLSLPAGKTALQIMLITILPVSGGMIVLHRAPLFAQRSRQWVRLGCMFFLPLVIIGVFLQNDGIWFRHFAKLGALTISLNILAIALGFGLGKLARLNVKQTYTLAIEVGAQNAMLGVAIAISPFLLDNARIAMVPSIYAVTMVLILSLFVTFSKLFRTDTPDVSTTV